MNSIVVSKPAPGRVAGPVRRPRPAQRTIPGLVLEETSWGYIIRREPKGVTAREIVIAAAWALGIALLVSAAGMVISPAGYDSYETFVMKIGLALLVAAIGVRLVWYSSRGTEVEVQVDRVFGEVRQVVRNKVGKPTMLSKLIFSEIGSVFIDRRSSRNGQHALLLRYKNTPKLILAAGGPPDSIETLRDRLGRELMEFRIRSEAGLGPVA